MKEEYETISFGEDPSKVDYGKLYENRLPLLRKAFERGRKRDITGFLDFCESSKYWIDDYSLYMALKTHFKGVSYHEWPAG